MVLPVYIEDRDENDDANVSKMDIWYFQMFVVFCGGKLTPLLAMYGATCIHWRRAVAKRDGITLLIYLKVNSLAPGKSGCDF